MPRLTLTTPRPSDTAEVRKLRRALLLERARVRRSQLAITPCPPCRGQVLARILNASVEIYAAEDETDDDEANEAESHRLSMLTAMVSELSDDVLFQLCYAADTRADERIAELEQASPQADAGSNGAPNFS